MVRTAAGAGALAGVGVSLLVWQVTRESPAWPLILLGIALCVGAYVTYLDASEKDGRERRRYRATLLAVLDFAEQEVAELQDLLEAGLSNKRTAWGVQQQRNAYQAVAERIRMGLEGSPATEGGSE